MNATNFGTNKDFRKTVDIRQKVRKGKIERKIYLPPEDFSYGLPNRPPTPFKDVIYNAYGNRAEDIIRNEYDNYIRERSIKKMINALKTRIRESDRPVGTKRPNLIKLPPEGHVYGLEGRKDPEGVDTSN